MAETIRPLEKEVRDAGLRSSFCHGDRDRGVSELQRDALIWFTVLELVDQDSEEPIVLLTKNTKDFAKKNGTLHADLVGDLRDRGDAERVTLFEGLQPLFEKFVEPAERELAELRSLFNGEEGGVDDVQVEVGVEVYGYLQDHPEALDFEHAKGAPGDLDEVVVQDVEVDSVESTWAERVDGRAVLYGDARILGAVELTTTEYSWDHGPVGSSTDVYQFSCEVEFSVAVPDATHGAKIEIGEVQDLQVHRYGL